MGTNYYVKTPRCPRCGRHDEDLHIGKASAGLVFALRVYPNEKDKPKCALDWVVLLASPGTQIRDEYGADIDPMFLLRQIFHREAIAGVPLKKNCSNFGRWDEHSREFS